MTDLIHKAMSFAQDKHKDQLDDSGKSYYEAHLLKVFNILFIITDDNNLLCAGLLHDTMEDTKTTYSELMYEFNTDIADLVMEVTHERVLDVKGNVKATLFPRLRSKRGITLKFADRLSNISRMEPWDKKRQEQYLKRSKFWYNTLEEKEYADRLIVRPISL